jgi:YebC/PmpR family DNA-binding regulatory protein
MSGHSKWSTIKRKKGAIDAKRSKMFTKYIKEITVAARMGGPDLGANPRLRLAVDTAKSQSMQRDTIERAIKKGAGLEQSENYEEITYEGYAPGGVAILVDCLTDNKVRTVSEVRSIFGKRGGNMGESGSVAWMFEKKGSIQVDATSTTEDALMEKALNAGADDIQRDGDVFEVVTSFVDFLTVKDALEKAGVAIKEAKVVMTPKMSVPVTTVEDADKVLKLIDALEDSDDVQNVWANFDIEESILDKIG